MVSGMNTFGENVTRAPWAASRSRAASAMRSPSGASSSEAVSTGGSLERSVTDGRGVDEPDHSLRGHVRRGEIVAGADTCERVALVGTCDGEDRELGLRDRREGER